MSKKSRIRRLWLNITQTGVNVTKREFIERLIQSINDGTYVLPREWQVTLHWRNKETAPMRSGPWQEEMEASAESSEGWDSAVLAYLRRKL